MNLLQQGNPLIPVQIQRNDGSGFMIEVDRYSTVFSLKEKIFEKTGYYPKQQRLVFAGKILKDDMSLSFYNIYELSKVFLVPTPSKVNSSHPRPYRLLNRLLVLLDELPNTPSEKYTLAVDEINEILSNPIAQSFCRINSDVQQLFKDAREIVANTDRPLSRKTKDFIARSKDSMLDQFDSSPEGFRILQSLIDEPDNSVEDDMLNENSPRTNIKYKQHISVRPLPDPWNNYRPKKRSVFQNAALRMSVPTAALLFPNSPRTEENLPLIKVATFDSDFSIGLKSKFAEQMNALKKMGFNDENIILQALSETNGNVQLAAQLLRNKFM